VSLESEKIIIRFLESEKIGSLESENRVPTGPYRVPNIFLKKNCKYRFDVTLRVGGFFYNLP